MHEIAYEAETSHTPRWPSRICGIRSQDGKRLVGAGMGNNSNLRESSRCRYAPVQGLRSCTEALSSMRSAWDRLIGPQFSGHWSSSTRNALASRIHVNLVTVSSVITERGSIQTTCYGLVWIWSYFVHCTCRRRPNRTTARSQYEPRSLHALVEAINDLARAKADRRTGPKPLVCLGCTTVHPELAR